MASTSFVTCMDLIWLGFKRASSPASASFLSIIYKRCAPDATAMSLNLITVAAGGVGGAGTPFIFFSELAVGAEGCCDGAGNPFIFFSEIALGAAGGGGGAGNANPLLS